MVELESEGELTRSEVAAFLREFAHEIDDGTFDRHHDRGERREGGTNLDRRERKEEVTEHDQAEHREEVTDVESLEPKRITLIVGGDSATVTVPQTVEFDVEIESRSPMLSSGVHQGIELELSWEIENPDDLEDEWIEVE